MAQKKYVSLSKLSAFLDNLKNTFAALTHTHEMSDLTDYVVDTSLSSDSNNPIANSVVDAEFEAVATAMNALDLAIDGKSDSTHTHNGLNYLEGVTSNIQTQLNNKASTSSLSNYYTKEEIDDMELITVADIDTICGATIQMATLSNEVSF